MTFLCLFVMKAAAARWVQGAGAEKSFFPVPAFTAVAAVTALVPSYDVRSVRREHVSFINPCLDMASVHMQTEP